MEKSEINGEKFVRRAASARAYARLAPSAPPRGKRQTAHRILTGMRSSRAARSTSRASARPSGAAAELQLRPLYSRSTEGRSTADDAASGRASAPGAAATILSTGMRVCRRSAAIHAHRSARSQLAVLRLQSSNQGDPGRPQVPDSAHRSNLKLTLS
jgi:hypothetical protein